MSVRPLRDVEVIRDVWVTTSDGCRVGLRIWIPVDAAEHPVPAVLECHPYRRTDCAAPTDESRHRYTAEHGYASIRMDLRGSGDSDGVLLDEYLPQEQLDICEVIAWLVAQPWCTGKVGMYGISWGAFNSLQVAARRPPGLAAIVSVCGTDDRYADDVHYMGGCVLGAEMLSWSTTMLAYSARPPDPDVVGSRWHTMWMERLDHSRPLVETWLAHQRRDDYWKQGSVCEDYGAIECPVFLVGGWADGYRNSVFRMLDRWPQGVTRALVGPWGHMYPQNGVPGPAIGFMQELIRWWDHWLLGRDSGLLSEPPIRVWIPDAVEPHVTVHHRAGHWIELPTWPDSNGDVLRLYPTERGLVDTPVGEPLITQHMSSVITASHPGAWCAAGRDGDFPNDQRAEDGQSLTYVTQPLERQVNVLGVPSVTLRVATTQPVANLVVRLCDVAPDGTSTLITRGVLNLTHRDSHESPSAFPVDEFVDVEVRLGAISYAIPAGHRLRLGVSTASWPLIWPSPANPMLSLDLQGSSVSLPVHRRALDSAPRAFGEPEASPPLAVEYVGEPRREPRLEVRDIVAGRQTVTVPRGYPVVVRFVENDLTYDDEGTDVFEIAAGDPLSATARSDRSITMTRADWTVRLEVQGTMTCTDTEFVLEHALDAFSGEDCVLRRTWELRIPRDLV